MDDRFGFAPDPENPGWHVRPALQTGQFLDIFGDISWRVEPDGKVRVRVDAQPQHRNINEAVHGGFLLALVDQALFVGPAALGIEGSMGGVTIDTAIQFFAPVAIGKPVDVLVEVLRETGRMIFMRGLVEQDGSAAMAFSGTIKKAR